jgi:hypothetical protein
MVMRYLGGINSPSYNPLAANVTTGATTVQQGGVYTTASVAQANGLQQWVGEPFFNRNGTLLQADNFANGSQNNTFLDTSGNGSTITRNGNTAQGTYNPFSVPNGYWNNNFDGTSTSFLTITDSSAYTLGANDFTIEGWVFLNVSQAHTPWFIKGNSSSYAAVRLQIEASVVSVFVSTNGSSWAISTGYTFSCPIQSWFHVAVTRSGTSIRVFVNGVLVGAPGALSAGATLMNGTDSRLGAIPGAINYLNGAISNFRIVTGTALYTANFTPPRAPFTATTNANTQLLMCQSNRFVDNSTNAIVIVPSSGSLGVIVRPTSPFNNAPNYTSSINSGGFYVDGTGDYLTITDSPTLELGANSFCYECFFFATTTSVTGSILQKRSGTGVSPIIIWRNSANIQVYLAASTQGDIVNGTSLGSITTNQWYHVAVYRIGTAIYGSLNGVITTLNANTSASVLNNSTGYTIGMNGDGTSDPFTGFFSNARLVIGSGVYTSTSAPIPTAPLTAITNSRLLISSTNAAISDATAKNNFETAAQAQVTTVIKKYGSGSMFFDGSGDWVTAVNNPDINLSTGDFTIEGWINFANAGAQRSIAGKGVAGSSGWEIYCNATPTLFIFVFGNTIQYSNNYNFNQNQWYHIAVVRAGTGIGNLKMFIDGFLTLESAVAINNDLSTASPLFVGAGRGGNTPFLGYIDDFRITKGVARYTTTFVPPATALPRQGQG